MGQTKSRFRQFTDEQWERIEPLLPSNEGRQGHPFRDNRKVVEGIIYRYRAGIPWRDLPREEFGAWQTVWKRHARYAREAAPVQAIICVPATRFAAICIAPGSMESSNNRRGPQFMGAPRRDPDESRDPPLAFLMTPPHR